VKSISQFLIPTARWLNSATFAAVRASIEQDKGQAGPS
jgi:hypothetical protein